MSPEEDAERDAWLAKALRHAPDAALGAPPSLSDAILREARSATAAASAASGAAAGSSEDRVGPPRTESKARGMGLGAAWTWLGRPSVAAGFASILAATLVGMLWWGRPMDDTMPRGPEPVAQSPAPRATPQPASPAPARPTAPAADKDSAEAAASVTPPSAAAVAPPARDNAAAAKKSALAKTATPVPDESAPSKAERAGAASAERRDAPKPEPFPAAAEPPTSDRLTGANAAKTPRSEPGAEPKAAGERSAQDTRSAGRAEPLRRQAAAPSAQEDAATEPSAAPAAPAAPVGRLREMAKVGASPLATLRSAVATEPQRWTWQLDGQPARPINPTLQRWLEHADAAFAEERADAALAQAPRSAVPAPTQGEAGTSGVADAGLSVRLLRDGREQAVLRVGSDDLQVDGAATGARRTGLAGARATALKAELAAVAR